MSRATTLGKQIERAMTGPMWHGPALAQVLETVTSGQAAALPIPGAHSIWEIVQLVTTWAEIARERIHGQSTGDPTPERDWPPVTATGDDEWRGALERLESAHRMLAADVRQLTDDAPATKVKDLDYSVWILLHGVVEHGTYHGGQIALLKRAGGQP